MHNFANNLVIQNNATLSGCGTINGNVTVDAGGAIISTCATQTFSGIVTNNGNIVASDGTVIDFLGPVVNNTNGVINGLNGTVHFATNFQNNGTLLLPASTNSWTNGGSSKWEMAANWSLGTAPSTNDAAELITNVTSKTVTIDATTTNTPITMSVKNLTVSAPLGSTNTLFLNNAGTNTPLQIIGVGNMLTLDTNGALVVNNSAIVATNSGLFVGNTGGNAALTITNGGAVYSGYSYMGNGPGSRNNSVLVGGSNSVWYTPGGIEFNGGATLTISNGGAVYSGQDYVGGPGLNNNTVLVSGPGSVWSDGLLQVGFAAAAPIIATVGNALIITNGGAVYSGEAFVSIGNSSSNTTVLISGNGAVWANQGEFDIGTDASSNQVIIGAGGSLLAGNAIIGYPFLYSATNNVIQLNGGSLFVTNASNNGQLVVSRGGGQASLILNSGSATVNSLVATNGVNSVVTLSGGTINSGGAFVTNGQTFVVGNGSSAATYNLLGGVHNFANNLEIRSNAFLTGCGTINGNVVVDLGGTVLADCGVGGTLTFDGIVTNNGTMRAIEGSVLEAWNTVVNNGTIDIINGGTNFHGAFINNHGTVLTASSVIIGQVSRSGQNMLIQVPSVTGHTYQLEYTTSLTPAAWTNTGASQPGSNGTVLTFTDLGGATNSPARFYRVDCSAP